MEEWPCPTLSMMTHGIIYIIKELNINLKTSVIVQCWNPNEDGYYSVEGVKKFRVCHIK